MRKEVSLTGIWQFNLDPSGVLTPEKLSPDRNISVPLPWQAAFPELQQFSGHAWYRRNIELDSTWLKGELLLHFGAVDYWCQVFINGQLAGEHEGGYTSFTFPISSLAKEGNNEIAVHVYDPVQDRIEIQRWPEFNPRVPEQGPPFDANHIPHGKQEWYINVGGIWQDVTLTAVPATYIRQAHITPDIHTGEALVRVWLGGQKPGANTGKLAVKIQGQDGGEWSAEVPAVEGRQEYSLRLKVENPRLWEINAAYLYNATVTLGDDSFTTRFGFREITTRDGKIFLNGQPIFLLAALDQDIYPDTIYTVPSEEFLRDEFQKAKELGLNCLRCHIKPPDPRYLDLADEMGLLVWAEIPSWRTFYLYPKGAVRESQLYLDDVVKKRVQNTFVEMVERDFNHPSLVIWTIVNEDWGTSLPLSSADRAWVSFMYDFCKNLDSTRLVVDNSACTHPWGPNIHVHSDLDDYHIYANIPDQASSFEQSIEQFNLRPLWTYSSQGDAQRTGQEPLVLSEFGNWGLPSIELLKKHYGGEPDWFKLGPWWSAWEGSPGWPEGTLERFREFGLDKIWEDYEHFATASQWHQFEAMKFEIETMRRQPNLSGYVITELSDIYWESNGLLDFARNPKVYHNLFSQINAPDMLIPEVRLYGVWDDQGVTLKLYASHFNNRDWRDAVLEVNSGNRRVSTDFKLPHVERGQVEHLGLHKWGVPEVNQTQTVNFELLLKDGANEPLAKNLLNVVVMPASFRKPTFQGQVAVISRPVSSFSTLEGTTSPPEAGSPEEGIPETQNRTASQQPYSANTLLASMDALGYETTNHITTDTSVAVTNYPGAELLRWVREGGNLLYLASGTSPFFWVKSRSGIYGGGWITSFSWLKPGIHRRLRTANPLGMPFRRVMPQYTLVGLPHNDPAVQGDFLAGQITGWVHHPAIDTVQFRYGKGKVLMTTFNLEKALPNSPIAVAMLHDLLEYLVSDACQPTLKANY